MKEQKKQNSKHQIRNTNNGITLLALIITIILMLILVSVTVNVAIDGGLFEYAGNAKNSTEIASEKEAVQKAIVIAESTSKTGRVTVEEMQKAINKVANDNTANAMDNGDTIVVKFNESNRYYEVDNKGKVEGPRELIKKEYAGDITKGGEYDGTSSKPFKITCIEDLVAFSIMTNGGNRTLNLSANQFKNQYIELTRTLDFKSMFSYNDYTTTIYGDLNTDGKIEDIRTELTKEDEGCIGFKGCKNFEGDFEGNYNEVLNIYMNTISTSSDAGLFVNTWNATIKNFGTTGQIFSGGYAGGIVVSARNASKIENCYNKVNIVAEDGYSSSQGTGGICGDLREGGIIFNCYNMANIEGNSAVGGISGMIKGTIENCYNEGKIITNATKTYIGVGGIAGMTNGGTDMIKNCYNIGEIYGEGDGSGGILGKGTFNTTIDIVNCFNLGLVEGLGVAGGIAGNLGSRSDNQVFHAKITNCYNMDTIHGGTVRRNCRASSYA